MLTEVATFYTDIDKRMLCTNVSLTKIREVIRNHFFLFTRFPLRSNMFSVAQGLENYEKIMYNTILRKIKRKHISG